MLGGTERPECPLLHRAVFSALRTLTHLRYRTRQGVLELHGVPVAFAEVGDPHAPPLLLVHGLRGEASAMLPLARAMARRGFRSITIDLPGHGLTPRLQEPLTVRGAGKLVLGILEHFDLPEPPVLVGHSMGGWICALAALGRPDLCRGLAMIASAGFLFEPPPRELLLPTQVSFARRSLRLLFAKPPWVPDAVFYLTTRRPILADWELLDSALTGEDLLEGRLAGLEVPATVIWGQEDRLIPLSNGRMMAGEIPGCLCHEITDAGHMVIWEKTDEVAQILARFLR